MTAKVAHIGNEYDYIIHPDGRAGPNGGSIVDRGSAYQGIQWAIDEADAGENILLAPGVFSTPATPLLKSSNIFGSVELKTVYVWDGANLAFKKVTNYPVPVSKILSTINNINSYVLRRNDYKTPITLAYLDIDGGLSSADAVQSRALFGGVGLYNSENTTIDSCYIHNVTHTAVYAAHRGDPAGYSATVRNCELAYCGLRYNKSYREYGSGVAGGGGGWDTGASKCLVENNYIHHIAMSAVNCEPGRNWLVQDNWLGCPWVYGLSESDKNKAPWTVTIRDWHGQASTKNVHRHNYVQTETGWGVVYNSGPKGNTCINNVIRHLRGAIVASGGASLADQTISGNSVSGVKIVPPVEVLTTYIIEVSTPPAAETPVEEPVIEDPKPEPAKKGGLNDASILGNLVKGGAVRWHNKAFGSSGEANSGTETELVPPDGSEWSYACLYMSNLAAQGYLDLRGGFHDFQTTEVGMNAGAAVVAEKIQLLLDAAEIYGISVTMVIGGLSDKDTAEQGFGLFDRTSALYKAFVQYAAAIADELYGSKIRLLELLNEADFITCVEKFWKNKSIEEFIAWAAQLVADVKAAQKRPGVPIGMGTAVDSTIYGMEWLREISGDTKIIDTLVGMCDVISVHSYIGEKGTTAFNVWKSQKIPAFVAAAKRLGKELIFGETGRLFEGGTYDADMDAVLQASGATYLWMVRRHDPKAYTIPAIPERPSHDTPAPDETPVEDPTSSEIEPTAQETPETPVEAGDPNENGPEAPEPSEEPAVPSEEPGKEGAPPEVVEEPPAVEDEPPAVDPVTPEPSEPAEETPADSTSSPTPGTGRNVLVELARRIADILSRLFKRK